MKQEDKELLIKDLCARLPYGVKALASDFIRDSEDIIVEGYKCDCVYNHIDAWNIEYIKPYLFSMSSMTEDQKKDYNMLLGNGAFDNYIKAINWLNARYFDYRGLIEKGLAIDATNLNIY